MTVEIENITNLLHKHGGAPPKGNKIEWISNCYSAIIPQLITIFSSNASYCLDTQKFISLPFNESVILGLHSSDPVLCSKLITCFTPLLTYLLKLKGKYDIFKRSSDFNLKYLKIDTLRDVAKVAGCFCDPETRILTGDEKYRDIVKLSALFLKLETSSFGCRSPVISNMRQLVWNNSLGRCFACHVAVTADDWHCGHILSVKHGGLTSLINLRAVCKKCNSTMGDQHMYEYMCENNLPGVDSLTDTDRQLWTAIVMLTQYGEQREPGLKNLSVNKRLISLAKHF